MVFDAADDQGGRFEVLADPGHVGVERSAEGLVLEKRGSIFR
jgi:hypothetical protein